MVAKPQIDGTARGRAGVPLARAQRLAQKADAKTQKGGSGLPLVSLLLAVAVLGGAGYFYSGTIQEPAPLVSVAAPEPAPAAVANPEAEVVQASSGDAVAEPDIEVSTPSTELVALFEDAPQLAPRPVLPPCVRTVEERLLGLYNTNSQNAEWDVKRQLVRDAVQSVLDCDQASFGVVGDFELASSDLADLQVNWDRSAANLTLTVVDSVVPSADQAVYTTDGQPITFIVN